jgi:hypothetical protein
VARRSFCSILCSDKNPRRVAVDLLKQPDKQELTRLRGSFPSVQRKRRSSPYYLSGPVLGKTPDEMSGLW